MAEVQSKSNNGMGAKALSFVAKDAEFQKSLIPATDLDLGWGGMFGPDVMRPEALMRGNWVEATPEQDDRWAAYANAPKALGDKMLPFDEWTAYQKKKRAQQKYLNFMGLSVAIIDQMYPETQERAYAIAPELKTVTEKNFRQEQQKQAFLYHIIQHGRIETREELMFIYEMLDPRFALPDFPLWDMTGEIRKDYTGAKPKPGSAKIDEGLWWQYVWSFDRKALDRQSGKDGTLIVGNKRMEADLSDATIYPGWTPDQLKAKGRICQRILPALRGKENSKIIDWVKTVGQNILFAREFSVPFLSSSQKTENADAQQFVKIEMGK